MVVHRQTGDKTPLLKPSWIKNTNWGHIVPPPNSKKKKFTQTTLFALVSGQTSSRTPGKAYPDHPLTKHAPSYILPTTKFLVKPTNFLLLTVTISTSHRNYFYFSP